MTLLYKIRKTNINAPTALFVHGKDGNIHVMDIFKRCIPETWNILNVQAPLELETGKFSWRDTNSTGDWIAEQKESADILYQSFLAIVKKENLSNKKTVAFGFSQGGMIASLLAQLNPSLFSGVAVLSSLIPEVLVKETKLPSFFIFHGTNDERIPFSKAIRSKDYLLRNKANVVFVKEDVGHKIGVQGMRELKNWVKNL